MAQKKKGSQAERAAASSKKITKKVTNTKTEKLSENKSSAVKNSNTTTQKNDVQKQVSTRFISSIVLLSLFVIFLVTYLFPDGLLISLREFLLGLLGKTGFIISIPVFLYLFIIHAFSGQRPVRTRTVCLLSFIILCGAIAHLPNEKSFNFSELYFSSASGRAGGLICGGISIFIRKYFGIVLAYILFIISAILTLLGGMQITIPSIIRAIQNRPRSSWEEEEDEEPPRDPAAVIVNHFANKRIENMEKALLFNNDDLDDEDTINPGDKKAAAIITQIDNDVDDPVTAATLASEPPVKDPEPEIIPVINKKAEPEYDTMPPLDLSEYDDIKPMQKIEPAPEPPEPKKEPIVPKEEKVTAKDAEISAIEVAQEIEATQKAEKPVYRFPPIDLLKLPGSGVADGSTEMRENTRRLNETLASFKIEAHIINVTRGPSVTRYEVELEKGVRLNKLTTAADDIALSLGATGVRIAAVPGKISVVGIEVPNRAVTMVSLREVIDSQAFGTAKSKSSFAVGKDIGGACIVGNISKLPHMLIAGTTGSGKSVCMNSIIISLLYKSSPDDVKLIMVDPKMVELGIYNGIPHLLIPVVTDPKKAAGSLQWAVTEMMRRYKAMSDAGVRDLESYNSIIESQEVDGTKLPQVVVIIDELADLMLVAAKEVEESICRIAQMGRAAGIHLIIATQRPSADVITGLMKANIPSRIAFAVASAMESRIILDTQGAEKLVGKGDMLYAPIGTGKPQRVQGCFVSDPEVEAVASYVKTNFETNYDQEVLEEIEKKAAQTGNSKTSTADPEPSSDEMDGDEMLPAAVDVILETGQASVSMLQRRLKLGYARAARIVDEMEEKGIVGPYAGSKPRSILITKDQWDAMRGAQPAQMSFDNMDVNSVLNNDSL